MARGGVDASTGSLPCATPGEWQDSTRLGTTFRWYCQNGNISCATQDLYTTGYCVGKSLRDCSTMTFQYSALGSLPVEVCSGQFAIMISRNGVPREIVNAVNALTDNYPALCTLQSLASSVWVPQQMNSDPTKTQYACGRYTYICTIGSGTENSGQMVIIAPKKGIYNKACGIGGLPSPSSCATCAANN